MPMCTYGYALKISIKEAFTWIAKAITKVKSN